MQLSVHRRSALWAVQCLILAGSFLAPGLAARCEAKIRTSDYLIDVWDTEHNLPSSTVTAIAQTPDGYLWVGTYSGLSRFDGVRFVTFDPVNTPQISHARVQGLYVDANGTLWINTFRGGLTSYRDGVFRSEWPDSTRFDVQATLVSSSSNSVVFVSQFADVLTRSGQDSNVTWSAVSPQDGRRPIYQCVDRDGTLWFLGRSGEIICFRNGAFLEVPIVELTNARVLTVAADPQGAVWIGAENRIGRWNGSQFVDMTPTNRESILQPQLIFPTRDGALWVLDGERLRKQVGRGWIAEATAWRGLLGWAAGRAMGVHEDADGGVWFNHYGNGLFHVRPDGQYERFTSRDGLPGDRVGAWYRSRDGGIWLGIDRGGLARLRERKFHVIGPAEGLPARTVLSLCEDADGAMWIGTGGGGLCRLDDNGLTRYSVRRSASANFVFSVFPRPNGGLWISAAEGEDFLQFQNDQIQRAPWDLRGVKSILTDRTGRVWMGTKAALAWWSPAGRRLFGAADGMALSAVRALAEAPDGTIWCGADDGTLYRCEPERLQAFRPTDSLSNQPIWSLYADAEGNIWAGTFRGGLLRFKDGQFTRFTSKQGLPAEVITQILEDQQGRLWLGTHQGISCVAKSALEACAAGKTKTLDSMTYGLLDGLPTLECSDGYQPGCWRSRDGRLWFATTKGVVSFDPAEFKSDSRPPPVVIEELRVDGTPVNVRAGQLVIPPGSKQFEFRFTALSFEAPDKMRFRYKMEGLDADWVEAGTRRTAQYGHLPARDYRFRVIACDHEGVWTEVGTALAFTVKPYFYQTRWFIAAVTSVVLLTVIIVVRTVAARKYRRELARLEQQHAIERDRARIAQDIHDDIGAGLTQITLLTELAHREKEQAAAHLDRISESARHLTKAMDEIVWAVDPQHDTLGGLMDYVSAFAEDFLRMAGIRCRMDLPLVLPRVHVDAETRYNLFLAVKETLNNIVKHSGATEVWLRLRLGRTTFTLVLEDNGKGLSNHSAQAAMARGERIASGSGLVNLEKRMADIGGKCVISSGPGTGTRVELTVASEDASSVVVIGANGESR